MQIRHAIHFQLSAFNYLIKGIDDTLEVRNLQGSTTNQTAVNIREYPMVIPNSIYA